MKLPSNIPLSHRIFSALFLVGLLLAACQLPVTHPPTETQKALTPTPTSAPTATALPPKTLTICTASEPQSLYLYDGRQSRAKANLLEAIYDGPFDQFEGKLQPVILEALPGLENGGLRLEEVLVVPGQEIVDANGQLVVFKTGVTVRPSGCLESACALTWDGRGEFYMDQMVLQFRLLPGLQWSDSAPLQASDSVYSYQLAADPQTPINKWAIDRTASYIALDTQTIEWRGIPGFSTSQVQHFFWSPLPQHAWSNLSAQALLTAEQSTRQPLGWGAFTLAEWSAGTSITFQRNPHYFRASEGLPGVDILTFLFEPSPTQAVDMLKAGECDLLDSSFHLESQLDSLQADLKGSGLSLLVFASNVTEELVFGIKPAAYDDGYQPGYGDRQDIFADNRTRQAIALCIDRERINAELLGGHSSLPGWSDIAYDPLKGAQLLESVGWKDVDADPLTPRQAWGVANVQTAFPFEVTLLTSQSLFDAGAAQIMVEYLGSCGIKVNWQPLPAQDLYAEGPAGPLFGRQFDLALLSWAVEPQAYCSLYQSWAVPNQANYWVGTNLAGFQEARFDNACSDFQLAIDPNSPFAENLPRAFNEHLPALPLARQVHVLAGTADLLVQLTQVKVTSDFFAIETLVNEK